MPVIAPVEVSNVQKQSHAYDSMLLPSQKVKDALARIMSLSGQSSQNTMALPTREVGAILDRYGISHR